MTNDATRALVLSGGGLTGIAWGAGLLTGLARQGLNLSDAGERPDLTIGTSAGASVGTQLLSEQEPEALLEHQLQLPATPRQPAVPGAGLDFARAFQALVREAGPDPLNIRRRIGQWALERGLEPETEAQLSARFDLPVSEWPQGQLQLTAVDAESGEARVFTRDSGVPLLQAVAASCAVPGVWAPVAIQGRRYMDGGVRSGANADLAAGAGRVLVVALMPLGNLPSLQAEVQALEAGGAAVRVVAPDQASAEAIGPDLLSAATRTATARAGAAQGERLAAELGEFWSA
ncbi:patatin-like phospholipase family protein [Deinococcus sp. Marseille-Q6407]|uniref:patatin-like phospholipase family protein n=1 Tax=Deinococcus sp. Marseille-Q6407 TaxID=2969223 RepID=UPI0021C0BF94|nr:patatin-like phospholipase family protein [Deinococcus sp. Marseille-Q6407]